ncbi:YlbE-like family protein [Mesobacillus harenae]|uniref:YlbE-like family protein n=1 Tax=Mesobacillus harenae TaxID=2213203 RepID=UPI00157FDAC9|nr:YlbE-like family protein [Mesobacillus harenae]
MRKDVMDYLKQRKDLRDFVRAQPQWYRKLSRNPHELQSLEVMSLHYYEKTIPHRVQKFSNGIQMASMMMHMFANNKNS